MRVVILCGWGGKFIPPILKKLSQSNLNVVKIYSLGVYWERIKASSPSYFLNYKDNIAEVIERIGYEPYEIVSSVNNKHIIELIKSSNIDYIFTIGYGEILKKEIINAPLKGIINFHPGLLPENQGADPIAAVLLNDLNLSGVTFHYIDEGIDTGKVIIKNQMHCPSGISYAALQLMLGFHAASLIEELIEILTDANVAPIEQDKSKQQYFKKLTPKQGQIKFAMKSEMILRIVNTFSDFPKKAYFLYNNHEIYVGNCEIIENAKGYAPAEIIDQGLGYLCVATDDSAVLLKDLFVGDMCKDLSNQFLNKFINSNTRLIGNV